MSVDKISLNNKSTVQPLGPQKAGKARNMAFKGYDGGDEFVYVRRRPSFWDKYKGMILSLGGMFGALFAGSHVLKEKFTMLPQFLLMIAGGIIGSELSDRL